MPILSVAKTIRQIRDGFAVILEDENAVLSFPELDIAGYQIRAMLTPGSTADDFDIRDGRLYKNVTRRGGWSKKTGEPAAWKPSWLRAKVGDEVELTEWSARVGPRWVCGCGWLGPVERRDGEKAPKAMRQHWDEGHPAAGDLGAVCESEYRKPRIIGTRRFTAVDQVRLGDITPDDVIREGFPGWTPEAFIDFYCGGKPHPDGIVTRLEMAVEA